MFFPVIVRVDVFGSAPESSTFATLLEHHWCMLEVAWQGEEVPACEYRDKVDFVCFSHFQILATLMEHHWFSSFCHFQQTTGFSRVSAHMFSSRFGNPHRVLLGTRNALPAAGLGNCSFGVQAQYEWLGWQTAPLEYKLSTRNAPLVAGP